MILVGFAPPPLQLKPICLKKETSAFCAIKGPPAGITYENGPVWAGGPAVIEHVPSVATVEVTEYCEMMLYEVGDVLAHKI